MLTPKLPKWVWILIIIGIFVLIIALMRGCSQSKTQATKHHKLDSLNTVLLQAITEEKSKSDSIKKAFQDSLEFERGQVALAKAQKIRTEAELQDVIKENRALIAQHKLHKYADTSAVTVPHGFVTECEGCFVSLEKTTNIAEKYKRDNDTLSAKQANQDRIYKKLFQELDQEKLGFYNKISALAKAQQDAIDKLKPHGRLYLSWGVLWRSWPVAAGAGLMYQNKRNLIWGAKWYYGSQGTTIETSINLPLSLNFR